MAYINGAIFWLRFLNSIKECNTIYSQGMLADKL